MKNSLRAIGLLSLLVVGCEPRSGARSTAASPAHAEGPFERPGASATLRKGETHQVEIDGGQRHEWGIALAAGEPVTLSLQAVSTGATMCQGFLWGFYNPSGGALREQPMGPEASGRWSMELAQVAEASIVEGPTAGRYTVRVETGADCPQLRYTLSAR